MKKKGFTLIELMIVLLILTILALVMASQTQDRSSDEECVAPPTETQVVTTPDPASENTPQVEAPASQPTEPSSTQPESSPAMEPIRPPWQAGP